MTAADPDIEQLCETAYESEVSRTKPRITAAALADRQFKAIGDDRYCLAIPGIGVALEIDRLRRDHNELFGELSVRCELPGARTIDGSLSIADFNLSSTRARMDRTKLLAARAGVREIDWGSLVEEFCQRVLQADRIGQPAVDLRELPRPDADTDMITVEGLALPKRHPSVLFGDGGACKSYLALYLAGRIAEKGLPVALFDWELAGDDHRDRLERLFSDGMPQVFYARCERPLVYEVDHLRRIMQDNAIEYAVFDSVAFACDGPPEAAETAGRYFRAVRQIGGGSLHVAHVSKGENSDRKPFGSAFWHNGARCTWFIELAEATADSDVLQIGLFNRKSNLGRLRPPMGFSVTFGEQITSFRRTDVGSTPDLADKLTVRQRMAYLLRGGSKTMKELAQEIDAKPDTIERTAYRNKELFIVLDGGRVGLLERKR
ncbi:MAG: AAA family ATPase [Acidobacteriia bacterium]|nr:AAA family ATPase [Terriglobia bacterium]